MPENSQEVNNLQLQLADLEKYLTEHDEKHLHLVELAGQVGEIAAQEENSSELFDALMKRLNELKQEEPHQPKNSFSFKFFVGCWKVVLAFGILVASQKKPDNQKQLLNDTLLKIVNDETFTCPKLCRRLALSELTYVDQYLHSSTDRENDIRRYCKNEIYEKCLKDAWASPIRDYAVNIDAWNIRSKWKKRSRDRKNNRRMKLKSSFSSKLFAICSVKGGVGKTITALALYNYVTHRLDPPRRALLIDVDVSGPTLQYHLSIPKCVERLSVIPPEKPVSFDKDSLNWCYPTFANAYQAREDIQEEVTKAVKNAFLKTSSQTDNEAVVLPDSPTLAGRLEKEFLLDEEIDYFRTLEIILDEAQTKEFDYIFLDFSPGLIGRNGNMLRWLCDHYKTRLLLISSTRAPDIATALYDGTWAAAQGEFNWSEGDPVLHLINMWPEDKDFEQIFKNWTEDFARKAFITNLKQDWHFTTSATQIYFWRMWCYLYVYGVKHSSERIKIGHLPRDPDLTEMLSTPMEREQDFKIEVKTLLDSDWMKELAAFVFEQK